MRVGLDGTPLLGHRTGVGRYVNELVRALRGVLDDRDEMVLTAFTLKGARQLTSVTPPGVSDRSRPVPARLLQACWQRSQIPTVGLLSGRVDVFHGTNFVLPPTGRSAGVVTIHDLAYLRLPETVSEATRRYVDLVPRSLARARAVCVPSQVVAAQLAETYPQAADRIVVTPLGVDTAWSLARPASHESLAARGLDREYLLFVGTLEPRKDLDTVVRAYRLLAERGRQDLPLLALAGPAGWGEDLDLSGVPDGLVVRLGRVGDSDLRALVAAASALLYPSLYEGFGLPLLEAFASGTRVLASAIPTTLEVLEGAESLAGLFPPGDAEALAELIAEPAAQPEDASARRRAHARQHTWRRTAEATVTAYRRALG